MQKFTWQISLQPSARLTHGLKLATALWRLRCSVLRETPVASAIHFKRLKCYLSCRPIPFSCIEGREREGGPMERFVSDCNGLPSRGEGTFTYEARIKGIHVKKRLTSAALGVNLFMLFMKKSS
jgi:hypothetical protein